MALPRAITYACIRKGAAVTDQTSPSYNGGVAEVQFQAAAAQAVQEAAVVTIKCTAAMAADFTVGNNYTITFS
jgi:hypothetical protein